MSNDCEDGFILGQYQQCEPAPILNVEIKNANLASRFSGHYVSVCNMTP